MGGKSVFSGESRATYGIIATFDRDGERFSKHFNQLLEEGEKLTVKSRVKRWKRTRTRVGTSSAQQVIDFCDKHGCKVVCMSSPETILRDMKGTRARTSPSVGHQNVPEGVTRPERQMLRGRPDLLLETRNAWAPEHRN